MPPRVWLFFAAIASAVLTAGCGSVVQSTEEASPPPSLAKMEGLTYWLPKGAIMIEGKWDKDSSDWMITVSPYIDADTSRHWRLTRKVNHLFEDNVTLEVDATTGLLQTVNATSEDKTAAIAATGLAIAAKAMTFGAAGAAGPSVNFVKGTPAPTPCGEPVEFTGSFRYVIDSSKLLTNQICETLVVRSPPTPSPTATPPTPTPTATPPKTYTIVVTREDKGGSDATNNVRVGNVTDGIIVRAPVPYRVVLTVSDKSNLKAEQLLFLPDTQRDYYLPLDRSPFVKNDTQITLVKGVVQKYSVGRPSIILGIVGVPKTILDALVPLPH